MRQRRIVNQFMPQPDEPETLVVELQGVEADSQTIQQVLQETKGDAKREAKEKPVEPPPPPPVPPPETIATQETQTPEEQPLNVAENGNEAPAGPPAAAEPPQSSPPPVPPVVKTPPVAETKSANPGTNNVAGAEEKQNAQTIKADPAAERDKLRDYVKELTKKVQANLVYPQDARQGHLTGTVRVSFTILSNGQIQPESLKVITSSGQPKLDAGALRTIRASVPFAQPPEQMTVAIAVGFGNKH